MKKLIVPIAAALIAGIGGGTGYAYMNSAPAAANPTAADSVHAPKDSTQGEAGVADSSAADSTGASADSLAQAAHEPELPLTPADSIRALQAARAAMKTEPGSLPPHAAPKISPVTKDSAAPTAAKPVPQNSAPQHATTQPAAPPAKELASMAAPVAAPVPGLPEQRLAKIFAAMQAKDAGKVLEQMSDADVRTVLGMMSDKQAAAILATLPAARAAAISKGATRSSGGTP